MAPGLLMDASRAAAERLTEQFAWELETASRSATARAADAVDRLPRVCNETAAAALKRAAEAIRDTLRTSYLRP